ncbi:carboxypeptidase-like regulatory domain-containing protein [Chitinophaga silvatica]|uniref:Carboxypeptidase-like regulatory domain-containing protein n=1 Tax=Chitinophaga silvatica TaxID=2282649 RepID=A0A3E1Y4G7_9BACT|nr:DUF5686 and carboxypeptidase regulatory-like domain-containing protein [Chitinophaga silvatica]RFS19585.1 carboxypeptidase-like regulatory domain-containing protein [Chitinophaga silvatica]
MRKYLLTLFCTLLSIYSQAALIKGHVTDNTGQPLPYATIFIKGTTNGTTTNAAGQFQLELSAGNYTIVCQYIGFKKKEINIQVAEATQQLNFSMEPTNMQIKEVVIKAGAEDPAYAIIRQAIKKRSFYQQQVKEYTCTSYIKGTIGLQNVPGKLFGQKVDKSEIGVDSTGKGMVFLSESLTKVYARQPDDLKLEVISSRKSGGGLGFDFPTFISFYDNNVQAIMTQMGPRGFISPISENALKFYRYKLTGTFIDDGKTVNKIEVIPRRKNEPLFAGSIFITDDDWRIYSVDLQLTSDYQLDILDTLRIRQTHVEVTPAIWRIKDQVLHIAFKKLGFAMSGNFVNVYSNYNVNPQLGNKFFNNVVIKYDSTYNKQPHGYWDSIRPVPLEPEEVKDYHEKDSAADANRKAALTPRHIDSLQKAQKPVSVMNILWSGINRRYYFARDSSVKFNQLHIKALPPALKYNTVEGLALALESSYFINAGKNKSLVINPDIRYGLSNTHLNASTGIDFYKDSRVAGKWGRDQWSIAGGKRIVQFNQDNPINNLMNEFYTLVLKENYMKLYENWFGSLRYTRRFQTNSRLSLLAWYEDRIPVENTTDFVFFKNDNKSFTPNHPAELSNIPFYRHKALMASATFSFQPGQKYMEMPDRKVSLGSKYPTFTVQYTKGIPNIANSIVDYDKWRVSVNDNMNFKLFGEFKYHVTIGGFINSNNVQIPDLQHFNGNRTFFNDKYLNSFQLAPYYQYSTSAPFYAMANVEHHFNGLLTNKIPGINKMKWNLVIGSNAFYVNKDNNYIEAFAGLENIFKVIRVDVVAGYQSQSATQVGVRVGLGGIIGGMLKSAIP